MTKTVLITGCSTGIGRDLVEKLVQAGYKVVATARDVNALSDLPAALKLPLDVTRPESIQYAIGQIIRHFGSIDVLVNNAGYAVRGAVEEVPVAQAQQMFDTNVFGIMRMVQAVLPHMRKQKSGRIINISSVSGKLVTPANGLYSASKFALEGLSDALRPELAPFGIEVILIEPGSIKTPFHRTVEAQGQPIFSNPTSPYQPLYRQCEQVTAAMRRKEPGPEVVSRMIQKAIEARHPRPRYLAGFPFPGQLVFWLGSPAWDLIVRRLFKICTVPAIS